ncbi:hypothetical protein CMV_013012 [Castanea mollissima]|uniref:Uncharacterized protein n=1 Tax=Castanea mollissima TaxID=60419 RepID=A0A8J4R989_9ROSI|nr:hypothetical protein CMV_013012 [Castanea mollissima]
MRFRLSQVNHQWRGTRSRLQCVYRLMSLSFIAYTRFTQKLGENKGNNDNKVLVPNFEVIMDESYGLVLLLKSQNWHKVILIGELNWAFIMYIYIASFLQQYAAFSSDLSMKHKTRSGE